ncbi:MAG: PAS domain-containing protein [Terriglobia bacterium]
MSKAVRDRCIFARQNLAEDPPFSQINLIACSNLLIYLGLELQRKIMPILHYALRLSGFLFLGSAASVAAFPDLFAPVDKKHKIFIKKAGASRLHYDFSANQYPRETAIATIPREEGEPSADPAQQAEADRIVLKTCAPPAVVINEGLEILQFRGAIGPYVEPAPGKASLHLLRIVRKEFIPELRAAVIQAKKSRVPVKRKPVEFRRNGQLKSVKISVEPLGSSRENRQYLILFGRNSHSLSPSRGTPLKLRGVGRTTKEEISRLRRRVAAAEENLPSSIESKEASDEEYQSANEEILSANEELQSANEELETSKEELQSTNEELNTVNDELHNRNADLDRINSDLNNLIGSMTLPVVMVDRGFRIRRLTGAAAKILKVLPSDIGRPITDIRWDITVPDLVQLISGVVETLTAHEVEVQDKENHWYSLQIRPYRTADDKIDGAIIVLSDIDAAKQLSERVRKSEEFMKDILATVREPLLVLGADLKVLYANASFLSASHVSREETEGKLLYRLGNGQWNIPKLRVVLNEVVSTDSPVLDFEVEHDFPTLGKKTMRLNTQKIQDGRRDEPILLLAIEDVSARKEAQDALAEGEERYRTLFAAMPVAVFVCDRDAVIQHYDRRAVELWGREPQLGVEKHWCSSKLFLPDGSELPHPQSSIVDVLRTGKSALTWKCSSNGRMARGFPS